jgi:hypothetical protein
MPAIQQSRLLRANTGTIRCFRSCLPSFGGGLQHRMPIDQSMQRTDAIKAVDEAEQLLDAVTRLGSSLRDLEGADALDDAGRDGAFEIVQADKAGHIERVNTVARLITVPTPVMKNV